MITRSQLVLLEALRTSLFGSEVNYPDSVDWDEVVAEAKVQTVMGLISSVIPINDESVEQCKASYMRIMYEQDKLIQLFNANDTRFVILKGSAASVYYPKPHLRVMGDIDILVVQDEFLQSTQLLENNAYVFIESKDGTVEGSIREIEYSKNGVHIELHHHFSSPGFEVDDILEEAIERREMRALNGYNFPVLPEIENGIVLIGHINQHLKNNTLGLRQVIDWAMYLNSIEDIAMWERSFYSLAERVGMLELAANVTRMCNIYLGLPKRFSMCVDVDDKLAGELIEVILADGNFGVRADIFNPRDERRTRDAFYRIKRYGFIKYFTNIGFSTWTLGKHSMLKPLAFFYGVFRQLCEGMRALIKNKSVGKQMSEGSRRYVLYKKLGVRTGEKHRI